MIKEPSKFLFRFSSWDSILTFRERKFALWPAFLMILRIFRRNSSCAPSRKFVLRSAPSSKRATEITPNRSPRQQKNPPSPENGPPDSFHNSSCALPNLWQLRRIPGGTAGHRGHRRGGPYLFAPDIRELSAPRLRILS